MNTDQAFTKIFEKFSKAMDFPEDPNLDKPMAWWNIVLEYSIFMGIVVLDPDMDDPAEWEVKSRYMDGVIQRVEAYTGPHGDTLMKAYMAKRYSWPGKLIAPFHKAIHAVFLLYTIGRAIWHEWRKFW